MRHWHAKAAAGLTVAIGIGLLAALAQAPNVLFEVTFDEGLDATVAAGDAKAAAEDVELRAVSTRVADERAALFADGSRLSYSAEGNIDLQRGAIEFGLQPHTRLADNENHDYLVLGELDQANTLRVWKTQMFNDLRFRIVSPDGKLMDAITPEAAQWAPGIWRHIVCTWDLDEGWLRLYVDGSQKGLFRGQPVEMGPLPDNLSIGSSLNGQNSARGVIDDLRITDRPPPPAQIANAWEERFLRSERISSLNEWQGTVDLTSLALVPKPDFTFVVISDPHVSRPDLVARYAHNHRVAKLVEQINALKPAFVIDSGDIVTTFPGREDFDDCAKRSLELFGALQVPVYHAPGNHDIGNKLQITYSGDPGPDEVYKKGWYVNRQNLEQYRRYFGPDYFSFEHEGCHFIVMNNALLNSGMPEEAEQEKWLREDLEAAKTSRLIVVAMHNPLFWVGTDDVGTENYELVNEPMRGELIDLFERYKVHAVFTGHTHHRISNYLGGTKYLTLPSTTFARNFGGAYGLNPVHVVWDPERVGYYVVRVYGRETRINLVRTYAPLPPMLPLQQGNDAPRMRAIGLKSAEIGDSDFGVKAAPFPGVDRSNWNIASIIDGVKSGQCEPKDVPRYCWTSNVHPFDDQHEWLQVELPEAKAIRRVVLYPRPGNFGFPLDFTLQVSADGAMWETVAKREAFQPEPDAPEKGITLDLAAPKQLLAAKMDMTKLSATDHSNIRAAMMEVELLDEEGTNHALESLGAVATSGTQAGGNRKTVDDHFWSEPTQVGAKWVFVPPDELGWEHIERAKGQPAIPARVQRAFELGRPPGLNLVLPITDDNPLYGDATEEERVEAFRAYVSFMVRQFRGKAAGWDLTPGPEAIARRELLRRLVTIVSEEVRRDAPQARLFLTSDWEITGAREVATRVDGFTKPAILGPGLERGMAAVADAIRKADLKREMWVKVAPGLPEAGGPAGLTLAKALARAMVLAKAEGIRLVHWAAPGEPGGILNAVATPEPPLYAYRSVATLLSGATPIDADEVAAVSGVTDRIMVRAFRAADGSKLVALWQPAELGVAVEPVVCRLRPVGAARNPLAIDCLTCTVQELVVEQQGGQSTIDGLLVRDYPLVVRFAE